MFDMFVTSTAVQRESVGRTRVPQGTELQPQAGLHPPEHPPGDQTREVKTKSGRETSRERESERERVVTQHVSTTFNTSVQKNKHSSTSPVNPTPLAELACEPRRRTGSADDTTELLSSEMPAAAATPPPDLQQRQQRDQPSKHNKAGVVKLQQCGVHACSQETMVVHGIP